MEKEQAVGTLTMLGFPTEEMEDVAPQRMLHSSATDRQAQLAWNRRESSTLPDGTLNVEVTPNRPDALSVEGIARALRCYLEEKPALYEVGTARIEAFKDASVASVRPAFGCAAVRGVRMTDSLLRSLMQVQEKLHETLGRKRRKVAIGIHDMDRVTPPFRYFACGKEDVSFVPLDKAEKMTPLEILLRHEKGMAYAHLVNEKCPMITDSNGEVLSFPPIINGELTRLTESTSNIFIDCTGTSEDAVRQAVGIIAAALADRGGKIEEVTLDGKPYKILQEAKWALPVKESERLLGIKLDAGQVSHLLQKMGYRISGNFAYAPGYRVDVMNEVDLIEDVAIAYGFNNFEPRLPDVSTVGHAAPEHVYHELLTGLGFDEAITWLLSNPALSEKALLPSAQAVEIENPLTEDFTAFRQSLLPNLLSVLADSRDEKLPIRLYEIGPVAQPHLEERLAIVSMHAKASFSEIKGFVLSLAASIGKNAEVKQEEFGPFAKGRCAALYLDGKKAGCFGEISPQALSGFGLEQPVCAAEIKISL